MLKDKVSWQLFGLAVSITLLGIVLIYTGLFWTGFLPFAIGTLMLGMGWKEIKGSNPRQAGIVTNFGRRTETIVTGVVFVFDWFPLFEVRGVSIFDIKIKDSGDVLILDIRCSDKAYVHIDLSIAFIPDIDDDPAGTSNWKSGGRKFGEFDDAGSYDGVLAILKSTASTQIQAIAKENPREWMVMEPVELSNLIRTSLVGKSRGDTLDGDDLSGLGVIIRKCNAKARSSDKVRQADDDIVVEGLQRIAEVEDIRTVDSQIELMMQSFKRDRNERIAAGAKPEDIRLPSRTEVYEMVDKQRTLKAGKRSVIEGAPLLQHYQVDPKKG